ncbi:MAG TPA: hypothetical protein VMM82_04445, partial [Spirochaetia bacterium]|nr:hypothetical protein [Spirochaetia bacterium]
MRIAALAFVLVLLTDTASAQAQPAPAPAPPPGTSSAAPPASNAPPSATTAESLEANTLGADIASASYYELVAWCDRLGLDDSGSRKDLQTRLADHYKVKLPLEAVKGKRIITVKS